jgi:hypothetical protein
MAEMESGHPDELVQVLTNWLRESQSPIGSLPEGIAPVEWVVRQFINYWRRPARNAIDSIESSLQRALDLCSAFPSSGSIEAIKEELESAREVLQEDLRDHLGLYDWNREDG